MDVFDALRISASGLTAERTRVEAISTNLANARTTRSADGGPFQRRMPVFEELPLGELGLAEVQVAEIDRTEGRSRVVYDPTHPDADPEGYVRYPDIDMLAEMVDLMTATHNYEANANALEATRDLAMQALGIGR
jgi:flagellar basal-body rod protein FlgC